jgi:glutamate racemase
MVNERTTGQIGFFDSGFGGLTILEQVSMRLPQYSYLYLADRARGPYGGLGPEVINAYTLEAVEFLFGEGCPLVILACNTASAWALRNLQQRFLPTRFPSHRILGVIRPSVEALAGIEPGPPSSEPTSTCGTVAVLATSATVRSNSYGLELAKLAPRIRLIQQPCPLWVPLVEEGEIAGAGAEYFLHKYLEPLIADPRAAPSRILLGCTHYAFLQEGIRRILPTDIEVLGQAVGVAARLADWERRHPEMEVRLDHNGARRLAVTAEETLFEQYGSLLLGRAIDVERVALARPTTQRQR